MGTCLSSDRRQGWEYSPSSSPARSRGLRKGSNKRFGSRCSSSFDSKRDGQAQNIPGRMFLNGASQITSLFTQQGRKGTNQDAMIVWENFGSRVGTVFCGVFDGHGPLGHMVAKKVRDSLPVKLKAQWDVITHNEDSRENTINTVGSMKSEETASICLNEESKVSTDSEEKEKDPEFFKILKESFLKAFKVMDKELRVHPNIDCFCSGTTAVTLVKQGQDLVIGNIGDSRAVLGTRDENNCLNAVQLTVDLKPNLPREAERIRRCKGRVFALRDEPDVARVWLPNNDSPGLAMARAFGDFCLKDFGLISVPEISYRRLTERDEFIVLATDGIWDVLSNTEVVDVVASSPTRSSAARSLVELAVRTWRCKYPTSKIDDCAVVCLFLNADIPKSIASYTENQKPTETLDTPETGNENTDPSNADALARSDTVRASCDFLLEESEKTPKQLVGSQSHERPSNGNAGVVEMDEWSALEGVSRVNTLLTLPRFVVGGDKQSSVTKIKK